MPNTRRPCPAQSAVIRSLRRSGGSASLLGSQTPSNRWGDQTFHDTLHRRPPFPSSFRPWPSAGSSTRHKAAIPYTVPSSQHWSRVSDVLKHSPSRSICQTHGRTDHPGSPLRHKAQPRTLGHAGPSPTRAMSRPPAPLHRRWRRGALHPLDGAPTPQTANALVSQGAPGGPWQRHLRTCKRCSALPPCVTFRRVVAPFRGPGQSPGLPFACCVGSLRSVGRCGRCSCWCRFRVRGAQ